MKESILTLVSALVPPIYDWSLLDALCGGVCSYLDSQLRPGVTPQDCGEAYALAAAWIMAGYLRECGGVEDCTFLSAGDITIRRDRLNGLTEQRAKALLSPWLRDPNFVFMGVNA